MGNSSRKTNPQ